MWCNINLDILNNQWLSVYLISSSDDQIKYLQMRITRLCNECVPSIRWKPMNKSWFNNDRKRTTVERDKTLKEPNSWWKLACLRNTVVNLLIKQLWVIKSGRIFMMTFISIILVGDFFHLKVRIAKGGGNCDSAWYTNP